MLSRTGITVLALCLLAVLSLSSLVAFGRDDIQLLQQAGLRASPQPKVDSPLEEPESGQPSGTWLKRGHRETSGSPSTGTTGDCVLETPRVQNKDQHIFSIEPHEQEPCKGPAAGTDFAEFVCSDSKQASTQECRLLINCPSGSGELYTGICSAALLAVIIGNKQHLNDVLTGILVLLITIVTVYYLAFFSYKQPSGEPSFRVGNITCLYENHCWDRDMKRNKGPCLQPAQSYSGPVTIVGIWWATASCGMDSIMRG